MARYEPSDLEEIYERDFLNNSDVFTPGRRNDDAVDLVCICKCMNWDPIEKFWEVYDKNHFLVDAAHAHLERVLEYSPHWGTDGTMEAMDYSINY